MEKAHVAARLAPPERKRRLHTAKEGRRTAKE
jgi:hypothetical protein